MDYTKTPAYKWMEAVSKRASDEGFKVMIHPMGFVWKDKSDTVIIQSQFGGLDFPKMFHQSLVDLDGHMKWETQVEV